MTNAELKGRRPTWAESNLRNLAHNIRAIRAFAGHKCEYLLPVKADAYGHGMIGVAKTAIAEGVRYLGIASTDEGMTLRRNGIHAQLLILGLSFPEQIPAILKYNLIPAVATREFIDALDRAAHTRGVHVPVHVKIDTGMGRIGVSESDALPFVEYTALKKNIILEGVFTHFPVSDDDVPYSRRQLARFSKIIERIAAFGIRPKYIHAANSAAVVNLPKSIFNMIRPGLISYGYTTFPLPKRLTLKPVISVKSRIIFVKKIDKGMSVSYGRTYIAKRSTVVATVPIGYEDGLNRRFSNNLSMLVRGVRVPLIGRVTMDQCMLDVTRLDHQRPVVPGEEVVIIGKQGGDEITVEELAARIGTIPYEIPCMLSERVPLIYKN
ncbi:MAG: alanine racemase [Spirochaetes bacterium]|nr:alanine racemase [Spirochaetota bacterium]